MSENVFPPRIKFYQNHRPAMASGDYKITINGSISRAETTGKHDGITANNVATLTRQFAVSGERFSLSDQDVRAVFPANASTGEYAGILPHIILNRNTLPWERQAFAGNKDLPWLVLLLFDEDEVPKKNTVTVASLKSPSAGEGNYPALSPESGQHDKETLTVIDVEKNVLVKLLPSAASLLLLAHTRQGVNEQHERVGEENAVVFCNRLPAQGKRSTMHLVSVEGRYDADGFHFFGDGNLFRLVSLKSWEFYTIEHFKITTATLNALQGIAPPEDWVKIATLLDHEIAGTASNFLEEVAGAIGKDAVPDTYKEALLKSAQFNKTFDGLLKNLNKDMCTLRLPLHADPAVEQFLSQGLTPLVHHFRNGDRSASWYRGPFLPFKPGAAANGAAIRDLLPESADDLAQFYSGPGMLDITYSAAWEIGRLLALSGRDFSVSLFQWKRLVAQHVYQARQSADFDHLPVFAHSHRHELEAPLWEHHLQPWLHQLATLQSVPGNYLVPDEKLLPKESIRFFYVDKNWLVAALCGAFSIGGNWDSASQKERNSFTDFLALGGACLKGFLLRSDVVDGWPGLIIDGTDASGLKFMPLRRQLSRDVLLCLFNGEINKVIFHQKPEVMHFGLQKNNNNFLKRVRDKDGAEVGTAKPVDWQSNSQARVIDIAKLAITLEKEGQPAHFAMNMIEGGPRVIFNIRS